MGPITVWAPRSPVWKRASRSRPSLRRLPELRLAEDARLAPAPGYHLRGMVSIPLAFRAG